MDRRYNDQGKEILERDVQVQEGKVVITEKTKEEWDKNIVNQLLTDIKRQKDRLIEENKNILERHKDLEKQEQEYNDLLTQLGNEEDEKLEEIKK